MNICMMTNTYLPHVGGVARSVHSFTEKYRQRGHDTLVVAPTFPEARHGEPGVVRLPAIQNFNGSDFSVRLPIPGFLSDEIEGFQPSLVHSHHPFLVGDTAVRIARQWETPLVFTHHTLYERYTHYVPFDSSVMRDLAISLPTSYANLCSLVIAPSESISRLLKKRGVETPVEVVPTGVDVDFFQRGDRNRAREKYDIAPDRFVVGHVGRLAFEKNLEFLTRSVAEAIKESENAVFLVVGEGKARKKMEKIFADCRLDQRIIFTGKLSGEALADAYRAMDLFAFASTSETQGMVIAEAMAASLPVVALDGPGVREVVEDRTNGRLVHAEADAHAFATVIRELIDRPREELDQTAAAALDTARKFDQDVCVDKMLGLYERLLTENARGPRPQVHEAWRRIMKGIAAEWELVTQKANTISASISEEDKEV